MPNTYLATHGPFWARRLMYYAQPDDPHGWAFGYDRGTRYQWSVSWDRLWQQHGREMDDANRVSIQLHIGPLSLVSSVR